MKTTTPKLNALESIGVGFIAGTLALLVIYGIAILFGIEITTEVIIIVTVSVITTVVFKTLQEIFSS